MRDSKGYRNDKTNQGHRHCNNAAFNEQVYHHYDQR